MPELLQSEAVDYGHDVTKGVPGSFAPIPRSHFVYDYYYVVVIEQFRVDIRLLVNRKSISSCFSSTPRQNTLNHIPKSTHMFVPCQLYRGHAMHTQKNKKKGDEKKEEKERTRKNSKSTW